MSPDSTNGRSGERALIHNKIKRFGSDISAVASIEFAILALPFFFVLFAIIETSLSFTAQQMLSESAERISRSVKVGSLTSANTSTAQIRLRVCNDMRVFILIDCNQIEVDLRSYVRFQDVPVSISYNQSGDLDTTGFNVEPGGPDTINHLRLFYRWAWFTDLMKSKYSSLPNGKTLLFSSETWRNEP